MLRPSGAIEIRLFFLLLPWVEELRYFGVVMKRSRMFKCSLDYAKKGFYRAANAIFGKVGRIASEEVILQLIISKCIPVLQTVCLKDKVTIAQ